MPTFSIPIGGVVRAVTYTTIPGQASTNTHKWQLVSVTGGGPFQSTAFLTAYDEAMLPLYVELLSNGAAYYGTQMYLMNPIGLPPRPDSLNGNQSPGQAGPGLLPSQSSGLISLYTNTLGKIGQGRTYVPFPSVEDNQLDGTPIATYSDRLLNLRDRLITPFVVVDVGLGITGTFQPVLYRGGADVPRVIGDGKVHDAWATQRRRGNFGKLNKAPF